MGGVQEGFRAVVSSNRVVLTSGDTIYKEKSASHLKTYAFIFARGGSKGVPGKNIRPLAGKPLLAYSIEMAKSCINIAEVFVSTDDKKIKEVALEWGAQVIDRPPELARDNSSEWLAWRHAVDYVEQHCGKFDIFISLPTTSPLRNREDVEACLGALTEEVDIVITATNTNRSPWFNMVKIDDEGFARLLISGQTCTRRQDVPKAYDMTTVAYVTRLGYIRQAKWIFEGKVRAEIIPEKRALDIDTELDFQIAECLIQKSRNSRC